MRSLTELNDVVRRRRGLHTLLRVLVLLIALTPLAIIASSLNLVLVLEPRTLIVVGCLMVIGAILAAHRLLACPRCGKQMALQGDGNDLPVIWIVSPSGVSHVHCPACRWPKDSGARSV